MSGVIGTVGSKSGIIDSATASSQKGHIVQTKIGIRTGSVSFDTAGYLTAGIPVTITPAYPNSKMLIEIYGQTDMSNISVNAGMDSKLTRATGSSESESGTAIMYSQWMEYFNRDDFSSDYYPTYHVRWLDTSYPHEQITYGMFGRKYGGDGGNAKWDFASRTHSSSAYQGTMIVQEIKQ